jgi:hypothetical protein
VSEFPNDIIWRDQRDCTHMNNEVCMTCDFDLYYARLYPNCPWRLAVRSNG